MIAGTVFGTPSKVEPVALLGEPGLSAIVAAARVPVIAIGGITLETIPRIAAAGAVGFAAIGAFFGRTRPCRSAGLRDFVQKARARFDSVRTAS